MVINPRFHWSQWVVCSHPDAARAPRVASYLRHTQTFAFSCPAHASFKSEPNRSSTAFEVPCKERVSFLRSTASFFRNTQRGRVGAIFHAHVWCSRRAGANVSLLGRCSAAAHRLENSAAHLGWIFSLHEVFFQTRSARPSLAGFHKLDLT